MKRQLQPLPADCSSAIPHVLTMCATCGGRLERVSEFRWEHVPPTAAERERER